MSDPADWRHRLADRFTTPAARVLSRTGVTPNTLTVMGFLVGVAAGVLVARAYFLAGGLVVLLAGAFDLLDGPVARATGKTSRFGGLLDSALDRLSEAAVLAGILAYYVYNGGTWESLLAYGCFGQLPAGPGGRAGGPVPGGPVHQGGTRHRYVDWAGGRPVVRPGHSGDDGHHHRARLPDGAAAPGPRPAGREAIGAGRPEPPADLPPEKPCPTIVRGKLSTATVLSPGSQAAAQVRSHAGYGYRRSPVG